jgi:hypothetical protein
MRAPLYNGPQELGVTAVELLPPFEFDELEFQRIKSPRNHMARTHKHTHMRPLRCALTRMTLLTKLFNSCPLQVNVWGYSTVNFMAPMSRYGTPGAGPAAAAREFKTMVKVCHRLCALLLPSTRSAKPLGCMHARGADGHEHAHAHRAGAAPCGHRGHPRCRLQPHRRGATLPLLLLLLLLLPLHPLACTCLQCALTTAFDVCVRRAMTRTRM